MTDLPSWLALVGIAVVLFVGIMLLRRVVAAGWRETTGDFLDRLDPSIEEEARALVDRGRRDDAIRVLARGASYKDQRAAKTYVRFLPEVQERAVRAAASAGKGPKKRGGRSPAVGLFIALGFAGVVGVPAVLDVEDALPWVLGIGVIAVLALGVLLDRLLRRRAEMPMGPSTATSPKSGADTRADHLEQIKSLARDRGKIAAIKRLRELTGADLRTSKEAIEHLERTGKLPPSIEQLLI